MKKTLSKLIFCISIFILFSCKDKIQEDAEKKINWKRITIKSDNNYIVSATKEDSLYSHEWEWKDTVICNEKISIHVNESYTNIYFTQQDKDTLFNITYKLLTNPTFTDDNNSCYAGDNIEIKISTPGTSLICNYSSVDSWKKISPETEKLYQFLKSKNINF